MRTFTWLTPLAGGFLAGCLDITVDDFLDDTALKEDEACPVIAHDVVTAAQPLGQSVPIEATVTDNTDGDTEEDGNESGVFEVRVFFRQETATAWGTAVLTRLDESGAFGGSIPGQAVTGGGMAYYLYAADRKRNACTLPGEGESDPWHFRVNVDD
jgi:hypothetical protein